uniref:Uncharacterized protein n=1 Tax=Arundo donax TaxID=35708 RepID=A0A0A8ZYP9_ARUDO
MSHKQQQCHIKS